MGKASPVGDGSTAVPRAPAETGPLSSNRIPHLQGVFAEMKWLRRQSHSGGFAGLMSVIQQAQGGLQSVRSLPVVGEGCAQFWHWVSLGLTAFCFCGWQICFVFSLP